MQSFGPFGGPDTELFGLIWDAFLLFEGCSGGVD